VLRELKALAGKLRRRPGAEAHVTGRAHLVFDDCSIVEADLGPDERARMEYLARRAVAPPPPREP
jgi:hypothetical protein